MKTLEYRQLSSNKAFGWNKGYFVIRTEGIVKLVQETVLWSFFSQHMSIAITAPVAVAV